MPAMTQVERDWCLATVEVASEAEEQASSLLFELGAVGLVTLRESEDRLEIGAYFERGPDADELARMISLRFASSDMLHALIAVSAAPLAEEDWTRKWKEGLGPIEVGRRLVVSPSWSVPSGTGGRILVKIDPGVAFGTGTHQTTQLCLEAIERYWRGGRMLDVGTGTGILAIAAARLAPGSRITGIDIDPEAVRVARENVEANGVAEDVEILGAGLRQISGSNFDVVSANLTADVITASLDDLKRCLAASGFLILSGILTEFGEETGRAVRRADLVMIDRLEAGEWLAYVAKKA